MIQYGDTIRIIRATPDAYGNEVYASETIVPAIFEQTTGWRHGANQTAVSADITAFVDPENIFVQDNWKRLEGMTVVARFGGVPGDDAWYRVTDVTISRDSQLSNEIDNIQLALKKTVGLEGVPSIAGAPPIPAGPDETFGVPDPEEGD